MKKFCELCGGSKLWRPVLAWWYSRIACPKCNEPDHVRAVVPRDNSETLMNVKAAMEIVAGAKHSQTCNRLHRGEFKRMTGSGAIIVDVFLGVRNARSCDQ